MNMNKKLAATMAGTLALSGLILLAACNKNTEQSTNKAEEPAQPAAAVTPIDPATVATVSGKVTLEGMAPKVSKIDMSQDPGCKGANEAEVRDRFRADPWAAAGLLQIASVESWALWLDGRQP